MGTNKVIQESYLLSDARDSILTIPQPVTQKQSTAPA